MESVVRRTLAFDMMVYVVVAGTRVRVLVVCYIIYLMLRERCLARRYLRTKMHR